MNLPKLHKHYEFLEPGERFRLMLAAAGRRDPKEHERLVRSAGTATFRMPDHAPWAHAFQELAILTMIELVEEAAVYEDAFHHAHELLRESKEENDGADDLSDAEDDDLVGEDDVMEDDLAREDTTEPPREDTTEPPRPAWVRALGVAYAAGFLLLTKADGWKMFCERLHLPPFLLWEDLPGYERLQMTLAGARHASFHAESMRQWLDRVRPPGAAPSTGTLLSIDAVADATEEMYDDRVRFWGGDE